MSLPSGKRWRRLGASAWLETRLLVCSFDSENNIYLRHDAKKYDAAYEFRGLSVPSRQHLMQIIACMPRIAQQINQPVRFRTELSTLCVPNEPVDAPLRPLLLAGTRGQCVCVKERYCGHRYEKDAWCKQEQNVFFRHSLAHLPTNALGQARRAP